MINQNKTPLFDVSVNGKPDKLAVLFKQLGLIGFGVWAPLLGLADYYSNQTLALLALFAFFLGPIMYICGRARILGIQKGIQGFGPQLWQVFKKAILFVLLPAAVVTFIMMMFALQNR